ncbi:hypothetical protein EV379_3448 [Microterricola gilva]|uniref:Uncharacterized protein n=1 Tax=Microterricola gilva TaxID=393267 RepID=A0A4Q8AS24_9MICO|nr:hypothetical protein [Microterricola gilva]RZU67071.1 hypothetical protein EV379_3448 [Microterricola gilva]
MTLNARQTDNAPRRRRGVRLLGIALVSAAAALLIPSGVTGAYWTTAATGTGVTPGVGDWCATPDPATNPRAVRLSDMPTVLGSDNTQIRIVAIPVANNAAWNPSGGNRSLAVKLSSCATTTNSFSLRITAWSNSTSPGAITWASGSGITPGSRLNLTQGYGLEIQALARWGVLPPSTGGTQVTNVNARRFSWLVSTPRAFDAVNGQPSCANRNTCTPSLLEIDGGDAITVNTWAAAGNPTATFPPSYVYPAGTYARVNDNASSNAEWALTDRLNGPNNGAGTASAVTLVPSTGDTSLTSADGNLLQWVVMEWWGGTPSNDIVAEVVLQ